MRITNVGDREPGRREFLIAAAGLTWLWPGSWFRKGIKMAGIPFRRISRGPEGRHYLWIHGNERTAREVLMAHMDTRQSGRAFLVESTERNVALAGGGKIDPNRMWSREGAGRSLRSLNKGWTDAQVKNALDRLDRARPGFLRRLLPAPGEVIVALHNNGPGYSMKDELEISDAVALNDKDHPDEFMLCVQKVDFQVLSGGPFNVLLQNTAPKDDDGSLSRLCTKRGVRYVNIEAELGNAEAQRRMLDWTERVL